MSSYRTQITDAIKAQLTGKTIVPAERIFTALNRRIDPAQDLPAIMIYTLDSTRSKEDYGRSVIPRIVTTVIEAAVSTTMQTALNEAHALAESIEDAMNADTSLGNVVLETTWRRTMSDVNSHGSTIMGVCVIFYDVEMLTNQRPEGFYEFSDDGFTEPPHTIYVDPDVSPPDIIDKPKKPDDTACGPDGCDLPAWGGEL